MRNLTLYSNLYKIFCAEICPGCKVSIVRTGGCKFMECVKCKYQFCWWCLDEFYTGFHLRQDPNGLTTSCPFRYCFLHTIEVAGVVLLFVKLMVLSDSIYNMTYLLIKMLCTGCILLAFLAQVFFIREQIRVFEKAKKKVSKA